jgi:hypothetical protein
MGIGLVAHIPYQSVSGCLKYIMKGYTEFNYPQVGAKVPPPFANFMNEELA